MARGLTSEQLKNIRLTKNAINRVNKIGEVFGQEHSIWNKQATILQDLGIKSEYNPNTGQRTFIFDRAQVKQATYSVETQKELGKFKSSQEVYYKALKSQRKQFGYNDRESVIHEEKLRDEMGEWISHNLNAIYEYEKENGSVISRGKNGNKPSWDELTAMRQQIESREYDTFESFNATDNPRIQERDIFPDY